jgi:aldehyde:ferredoxin oxidoreductase
MPVLGKALGMKVVFPVDGMLSAAILGKWGTIYNNTAGVVNGDSPLSNWAGSVSDFGRARYRKLNPDLILRRETKKYNCYSCVIGCGGVCDTTGLGTASNHSHKPEYETVCAFGGLVGNDNLEAIFLCNDLCNRAGLDTISAGSTIAFALECWEKGSIAPADTQGLELRRGDPGCIVALLKLMIAREGIGDILADGVARASKRIGRGTELYAIHAGGQEPGMHDSRFDPMMGVSYSADPTPGRHTISASVYYNVEKLWEMVPELPKCARPYPKLEEYIANGREARKSVAGACFKQVLDAAGGCLFAATSGLDSWPLFEYLNLATGLSLDPARYLEIGRRIQTMRQAFNVREGLEPGSFIMHDRMAGVPPLGSGPLSGKSVPIRDMVREYWRAIGWDPATGIPGREAMDAQGIGKVEALASTCLGGKS